MKFGGAIGAIGMSRPVLASAAHSSRTFYKAASAPILKLWPYSRVPDRGGFDSRDGSVSPALGGSAASPTVSGGTTPRSGNRRPVFEARPRESVGALGAPIGREVGQKGLGKLVSGALGAAAGGDLPGLKRSALGHFSQLFRIC
jgi:hypothetical protein